MSSGAIAQAVLLCKQEIDRQPGISASLKTKLNDICTQAGNGSTNKAALKQAAHEVCIEVIKSRVPQAEQQTAEASCPAA